MSVHQLNTYDDDTSVGW